MKLLELWTVLRVCSLCVFVAFFYISPSVRFVWVSFRYGRLIGARGYRGFVGLRSNACADFGYDVAPCVWVQKEDAVFVAPPVSEVANTYG